MNFGSKDEITAFISASCNRQMDRAQFLAWIETILNGVRDLPAEMKELRDGSGNKIWKRFYEEFLPLGRLVAGAEDFRADLLIQLFPGDQSFDAQVTFGNTVTHLEVTSPKDGHLWNHIYKHMKEFGHSPLYVEGGVQELKDALESGMPSGGDAVESSEILEGVRQLAQQCLDQKCGKEEYRKFTPISLVVYVDDGGLMDRYELEELAHQLRIPKGHAFGNIYLVGSVSERCLKVHSA